MCFAWKKDVNLGEVHGQNIMDQIFVFSQNSHVEILTSQYTVMILGGGAFGRWLGSEGVDLMNGISILIKGTPESSLTSSPREDTARGRPIRKWALTRN